jgi:hypothetical protein
MGQVAIVVAALTLKVVASVADVEDFVVLGVAEAHLGCSCKLRMLVKKGVAR